MGFIKSVDRVPVMGALFFFYSSVDSMMRMQVWFCE